MAFHDVRFPPQIERGAQGGPAFSTAVVETTGGHEYRQANWSLPRYRWDVATGLCDEAGYFALQAFFLARLGRLHSFRFKDWSDYEAPLNSPVMPVPGQPGSFMLCKAYSSGPATFLRPVTKPVPGSVVLDGPGAVDHLTGIVAGATAETTWRGAFDVAVRFDEDAFRLTLEEVQVGQASGVSVVEVRE